VRILIIEDDDQYRFLLTDFLSKIGDFELVETRNPLEAVALLKVDKNIDLIICDFLMGNETGLKVLEYHALNCPFIPFILHSSIEPLSNVWSSNKLDGYFSLLGIIQNLRGLS